MHETIQNLLCERPVLMDGGWATELQQQGLKSGAAAEAFNLEQPEIVAAVAKSYVDAGSRIILTNTFGGTCYALERHGLAHKVEAINRIGAELSKCAAGDQTLVFASIGPSGERWTMGGVTEAELFNAFSVQAKALAAGGADGLAIETISDLKEAKIALKAAQETGLPVCVSMVYVAGANRDRTLLGIPVETGRRRTDRSRGRCDRLKLRAGHCRIC